MFFRVDLNWLQRLGYDRVADAVWIFPPKTKPLPKVKDFRLGNPSQPARTTCRAGGL